MILHIQIVAASSGTIFDNENYHSFATCEMHNYTYSRIENGDIDDDEDDLDIEDMKDDDDAGDCDTHWSKTA